MTDTHTLTIDGFTHGGDGVGRLDGKAVFVPGALPGETVTVTLTEQKKRFARGTLNAVLVAAPERVTPPCIYAEQCGGCDLQHVSPAGQSALKRRVVIEQLQRLGRIPEPNVTAILTPGTPTAYRSQVRMHVTDDGDLGFYAPGSHTIVPIAHCLVAAGPVNAARAEIGTTPGATEVSIRSFHDDTATVTLRQAPHATNATFAATVNRLADNPRLQLSTADPTAALTVGIGPHQFVVPADAFFQASASAAAAISATVMEHAGDVDGATVGDLYAGIGLFSVPLAACGAHVTAVESNPQAAAAARINSAAMPQGVRVVTDTVERFLARHPARFDVIVCDPPRTGANAEIIASMVATGPDRIVYVACDPAAFARDAAILATHGYQLEVATPIDAFPMTHHVEVVATFLTTRSA